MYVCIIILKDLTYDLTSSIIEILNLQMNERHHHELCTKYSHTNVKKFSISVRGVVYFNEICDNIIDYNIHSFKKTYKSVILESYL